MMRRLSYFTLLLAASIIYMRDEPNIRHMSSPTKVRRNLGSKLSPASLRFRYFDNTPPPRHAHAFYTAGVLFFSIYSIFPHARRPIALRIFSISIFRWDAISQLAYRLTFIYKHWYLFDYFAAFDIGFHLHLYMPPHFLCRASYWCAPLITAIRRTKPMRAAIASWHTSFDAYREMPTYRRSIKIYFSFSPNNFSGKSVSDRISIAYTHAYCKCFHITIDIIYYYYDWWTTRIACLSRAIYVLLARHFHLIYFAIYIDDEAELMPLPFNVASASIRLYRRRTVLTRLCHGRSSAAAFTFTRGWWYCVFSGLLPLWGGAWAQSLWWHYFSFIFFLHFQVQVYWVYFICMELTAFAFPGLHFLRVTILYIACDFRYCSI